MDNEIKSGDTHDLHKICCHETKSEVQTNQVSEINPKPQKQYGFLGICIVIAAILISGSLLLTVRFKASDKTLSAKAMAALERTVLPADGIALPIIWGDLGKRLVEDGVIDLAKFEKLYPGGIDEETNNLLTAGDNGRLRINKDNASTLLNLLWAFGLANKNSVLEKGPMSDKRYGGTGNFASTGGWTLATGSAMNHYSRFTLISLTADQQSLVEKVSQNIYRPCCGNSTYFPDCNHGMAMLGALELMAAQGVSEQDMYKAALALNSYWFPDTYLTIAQYMKTKGIQWDKTEPKALLSAEFSSASGYQKIKSQMTTSINSSGSSCGI